VRKPSIGAILLALTPFVAVCFSVSLWDRIYSVSVISWPSGRIESK
jgi:hypothetical protein